MNQHTSAALLSLLVVVALVASRAGAADPAIRLVVIVARGSPVKDISKNELRRVYTSDNVVMGGRKLVPFNLNAGTPERSAFDRAVLGMADEAMQRFWIDRKIRGQLGPPRSLPSPALAIKVAAKFPGAIAYVPAPELTRDVQAVTVDGLAYTDAAYAIVR